jgi:ferrochelatase
MACHQNLFEYIFFSYVEQVGKEVGAERIGRCAAPNDNPLFIQALADIVQVENVKNL